jgi:hypothetical protein
VRDGSQTEVQADQIYPLDGSSVVQRMTDGADDLLDIWSQQRNRLIYFNLSSAQHIGDPQTDPGLADPGPAYAGGLGGWPGYMPLATIPPLGNNLYLNPVPAYAYSYGYGFYTPSPFGFYGIGSTFGYVPGYRFAPLYPGGLYPYRGISSRPVIPGFAGAPPGPRPVVGARPVMPRAPVAPRAAPHAAPHR